MTQIDRRKDSDNYNAAEYETSLDFESYITRLEHCSHRHDDVYPLPYWS